MTHREEFRAYMKAVNRTSGNYEEPHLSEAQMIVYCRGELSEADREAAQAHLTGCQQCIALFRNARDFLDPACPDEEEVTDTETNEAWQSLLARVQIEPPTKVRSSETPVVAGDFRRPRDKKVVSRVTLALAASLLISFGALGWQTWRLLQERESRRQSQEIASQLESRQRELEQRLAQLEQSGGDQLKREREQRLAAEAERDQLQSQLTAAQQAREDIPVFVARLTSDRGAEDDVPLRFPGATKTVRLRLIISKPYAFPEYSVELSDQSGRIVRRVSGLRPTGDDGALSFLVNRATTNAGKYRLRLFGQQGKTRQQLGEYGLSVTVDR